MNGKTEILKGILSRPDFSGYEALWTEAPSVDVPQVRHYRELCAENKCGCYGTTWGCPPGSCTEQEAVDMMSRYSGAVVLYRRFEIPDDADEAFYTRITKMCQENIRKLSLVAKSEGIENLPLGDGGCTYCNKCSYPEPCRYPDRRVISISGMGVDMESYLKERGIEFKFEKGAVTLYSILLV